MATVNSSDLDQFKSAYGDDFAYSLDNKLMLNWYPRRIAAKSQGGAILELGVGHGYSTDYFSTVFDRHIVLDGAQSVIDVFREQYPNCKAEIIHTYFEEYNTDERFDVIVAGFVLEHVDDPKIIVERYKKFLKPGGSFFIAVPNAEALNKRIGLHAGLLEDLFRLSDADLQLGHQRLYSVNSLRELARDCNLREVALEGIFLKAITTEQITRLDMPEQVLQAMLQVGIDYPELCASLLMELALP